MKSLTGTSHTEARNFIDMNQIIYLLILILLTGCTKTKVDFEQIDFEAGVCFGECPIFEMKIRSDGEASYHAEMYNDMEGQFKSTLKKSELDQLINALEDSDFFTLPDNYSIDITDHPTYILSVKLKDGSIKTIEDYGPSGPEKLKAVYKVFFSLRQSQNWRVVK
jgi:hypothetical protein